MTHAKRTDENHARILKAMRAKGWGAISVHKLGDNFPDTICCYRGHTFLCEIKTIDGQLSDGQDTFICYWKGVVIVIRHESDIEYFSKLFEGIPLFSKMIYPERPWR